MFIGFNDHQFHQTIGQQEPVAFFDFPGKITVSYGNGRHTSRNIPIRQDKPMAGFQKDTGIGNITDPDFRPGQIKEDSYRPVQSG